MTDPATVNSVLYPTPDVGPHEVRAVVADPWGNPVVLATEHTGR